MDPKISVIVLAWNGEQFLDPCLSAVLGQDYPCEVVVVDNASTDGSPAITQKYAPRVRLIRNDYNLGFAGGNNVGLEAADGDIVVLLNQDTVVQPGWLRAITDTFANPTIGIVGCKALYPDGKSIQHAGGVVQPADAFTRHVGWGEQDHGQYDTLTDPDYVTGAAFAIHRRVLERLGGLDEQFQPAFFEEIDYCYRARRAGFRIVYQPHAVLYHHETTSLPAESLERSLAYHRNRIRFVLRHWNSDELDQWRIAELQSIQAASAITDLVARARGYWDNLITLPLTLRRRRDDPLLGGALTRVGQCVKILEDLKYLREQTHQRIRGLIGKEGQANVLPAGSNSGFQKIDIDALKRLTDVLGNQSFLTEPQPKSEIPLVGGFVDSFRRFWIQSVLRHYLMPILNQQSQVNGAINNAISEIANMVDILQKQNQSLLQIEQILVADQVAVARMVQDLLSESSEQ